MGRGKAKLSDNMWGEKFEGRAAKSSVEWKALRRAPCCYVAHSSSGIHNHNITKLLPDKKKKKKKQQSIGNWEEQKEFYPNSASTFWKCQKIRSALLRRCLSIYCIVCNTTSFVSCQTFKQDLVPQNTSQGSNWITVVGGSEFVATHVANEPHNSNHFRRKALPNWYSAVRTGIYVLIDGDSHKVAPISRVDSD